MINNNWYVRIRRRRNRLRTGACEEEINISRYKQHKHSASTGSSILLVPETLNRLSWRMHYTCVHRMPASVDALSASVRIPLSASVRIPTPASVRISTNRNKILLLLSFFLLLPFLHITAQSFSSAFNRQVDQFISDSDFSHAIIGLKVVDIRSGKTIAERNGEVGLPAASTQKVITASTAFELLRNDFKYPTKIGYKGNIANGTLHGDIIIKGSGDPTLGSWRYNGTKEDQVINEIVAAIRQAGIRKIDGHVLVDASIFSGEAIPDGWIWQDIGNYYGAGAHGLNWRENQYDLFLKSSSTLGSDVAITGTKPAFIPDLHLVSDLKAASARSGDNAYIYFPDYGNQSHVRGTIPINQNHFTISGTIQNPAKLLAVTLESIINKKNSKEVADSYPDTEGSFAGADLIHTIESPTLDSICYWFLNKSINLYGEALIKTLGQRFGKEGSTAGGVQVVQDFWKQRGIDNYALGIVDGSGLSPQNRITANVLVSVMQYAKQRPWFNAFYAGLPVINGIKMKSGTIGGGVAYTGYITSAKGDFVFSVIVNNYKGYASQARQKIWKMLDGLK